MSFLRPSSLGLVALAAVAAIVPARAAGQAHGHASTHSATHAPSLPDSAAVAAVVHALHAALEAGDAAAAMSLLAPDARILENGGLETREEYRSHHLPGDMAFAAAVAREAGPVAVTVVGDVAWAVTSSRTSGTFRDRQVNSLGVELAVLTRHGGEWSIRAIHWSSRQAR